MNAEIAIVNANVLEGFGLKHIIELILPVAVVTTYERLDCLKEAVAKGKKHFFHYFIGEEILNEDEMFFKERCKTTIILTSHNKEKRHIPDCYKTIHTGASTDDIMKQLLQLLNRGHLHNNHFPEEVNKALNQGDGMEEANGHKNQTHLTARELEVLRYVARGLSSKAIADLLCVSESTITTHRKHLMDKFHTHSATHLIAKAFRTGMVKLEDW